METASQARAIDAQKHESKLVSQTELLDAFIQKPDKLYFYQKGLDKMYQAGIFDFKWHWSWWAFSFGWIFLLYRKAYLAAFITFLATTLLNIIPGFFIISMIGMGGISSYFILKRFHNLSRTLQGTKAEQLKSIRNFGGYNSWIIWTIGAVYTLITTVVILMFIPHLTGSFSMSSYSSMGY